MKIGIVGGNSRVGTELAFLLRDEGQNVVPIVRNQLSGAVFEHNDFELRVADVTDVEDARRALEGLDVVIIAAHADVESNGAKRAKEINERIVRNAVQYSPANAKPIFFSSIAAYGDRIYRGISTPAIKVKQKRRGEKILQDRCEATGKEGYALRLGHVLGPLQLWHDDLQSAVAGREVIRVPAKADEEANVLHTVTLRDAVVRCGEGRVDPGVYNCVNEPQWTWQDILDVYAAPGTEFRFVGETKRARETTNIVSTITGALEPFFGRVIPLFEVLPGTAFHYLKNKYLQQITADEIESLNDRRLLDLKICYLDPIPGENLPGLPKTGDRFVDTPVLMDNVESQEPLEFEPAV